MHFKIRFFERWQTNNDGAQKLDLCVLGPSPVNPPAISVVELGKEKPSSFLPEATGFGYPSFP